MGRTIRAVRRALGSGGGWRDVLEAVGFACIVFAVGLGLGIPLGVGVGGIALVTYAQFGGRR